MVSEGESPGSSSDSLKAVPKAALLVSPFCPVFEAALKALDREALVEQERSRARERGAADRKIDISRDFLIDPARGARGNLIKHTFGFGAETRRKWRHGSVIRKDTVDAMLDHVRKFWTMRDHAGEPIYVSPRPVQAFKFADILKSIHDDSVSFEAFAAMLGMDKEAASRILDAEYFTDAPLLTDMYYERPSAAGRKRKNEAQEDFATLGGYYRAAIIRKRASGPDLRMAMTLHVKYIVNIRHHDLIRTKLKIPYYVGGDGAAVGSVKSAVYDGWVRIVRNESRSARDRGQHVVWLFQKRRDRGTIDFEFFITNTAVTEDGARVMKGRFLTLDQEGEIDSGLVTLTHVHEGGAERPDFMDSQCSVEIIDDI